jgi:RNA polymerase sigma-70 factor, ECF subfamily
MDRMPAAAVHWSTNFLGGALEGLPAELPGTTSEEARLIDALRRGEESAFLALIQRHQSSMLRVAQSFVSSAAVAEEVVQETWLGVLRGLDGFQGRSSLRSWIFSILANCARTRGARESRSAPFSSFTSREEDEPAVDPSRFLGPDHPRWPGHWASPPEQWAEEKLATRETLEFVRRAIEGLPPAQRQVITLRDVEGCSSPETCQALGISEGNQRVLLHRARSKVRAKVEEFMREGSR